jgi:predicted transcriptional regulator
MSETASTAPEDVSEAASLTVKLPRDLVKRLHALADRTTWDVSDYVREALADYIPYQEREIAAIQEAIDEADSGAPGIPHEQVKAWVETWGKPDEPPFPR